MSAKSEQFASLLKRAGINATSVSVIGSFVHVDTFSKHSFPLQNLLIESGFEILLAKPGPHMDGFNGFRVSARVRTAPLPRVALANSI